ncbi:MAG: hypothetical protein AAGG07_03790 [Planctomycetota bacterium]
MLEDHTPIPFDQALTAIGGAVSRTSRHQHPIVAIGGPVASGKTTLARSLTQDGRGVMLSTDDYLPDYHQVPEAERDNPKHADLELLARHLLVLAQDRPVTDAPIWSFHTHARDGSKRLDPAPLVVVEGIYALQPPIRDEADLRVFIDAPREARWARWERLELDGTRGWGVEKAKRFFDTVAEPSFDRFRDQYRDAADLVVTNP